MLNWWRKRNDRSQVQWAANVAWQVGELHRATDGLLTEAEMWRQFPFLMNFVRLRRDYIRRWGEEP